MNWHHYRFRSVWELPAPPAAVYAALERPEDYPRWWPQVREVTLLDDRSAKARLRSVLPYDLVVTALERLRDPEFRILEVELAGDLTGWARWTVVPRLGGGTRARYDQEVEVQRALMRRMAVPGRPAFLANHALMMRGGRRGLSAYLTGGPKGV
ncbi:SRPBCC family protein [Streptomyces sp. NPDC057445]|uniref:SRPBCC family protein n=1 Tax=Streptomyces sp. NPDC057445 TaxID=3346136 RepID=UPI0036774011